MVKAQATITLSRVNDGSPGVPGRTYFIEPSTLVLKKGQDNVISPGTVDFKAYYRDGNSASRTAYAGRFKIEETVDGTTWKTIYTSSANESSVKHSTYDYLTDAAGNAIITASGHGIVAAVRDIHMIRCTLYAAGGTTNALDTQSVAVVKDVKALTQEEVFNLLTNYGAVKGIYKEGNQLYINADYIATGSLKVGGKNNQHGTIKIYNSNDELVGTWTNGGFLLSDKTYGRSVQLSSGQLVFNGKDGKYTKISQVDALDIKTFGHIAFTVQKVGEISSAAAYIINPANSVITHSFTGKALFNPGIEASNIVSNTISGVNKITASYLHTARIYFPNAGNLYVGYVTGTENRIHVNGGIQCSGDFVVQGTKSRSVDTKSYSNRLLYCYEMPSPMFGDIGEGMIDDSGICYIYLDDIFTETINTGIEYQVFLQKEGAGDLWVDSKEPAFFIVKGTPGLKFSWEIKAKQRDFEYERLEDTETTKNDVEIIDYEMQGQKIFEEYLLEKETTYECSN